MSRVKREQIIQRLAQALQPVPAVHAFWLEGSDGTGTVDEYSDIDIWLDVDDEKVDHVFGLAEEVLAQMGHLDFVYEIDHPHPKIRQKYYHLEGTSEYLIIDFCIQLHSRENWSFIENDQIEVPKILFDKDGVITFSAPNLQARRRHIQRRLVELSSLYKQHSRVIKYVKRRAYLEAFAYYQKYVVNPLVEILRLKYTPDHSDYYLVHISHHLPPEELQRLEDFCRVTSVEDIERKTLEAQDWFRALHSELLEAVSSFAQ